MRRLLAIALAAGPLVARAVQTPPSGVVLFNDSTTAFVINAADCASTTQTVNLTWTVKPDTAFSDVNGTFQVFVSNQDRGTTSPYCYTPLDNNGTILSKQIITDLAAPTAIMTTLRAVKTSDLASVTAQSACASAPGTPDASAYVCVQWLDSSKAVKGYAKGTATLVLNAPLAPTISNVAPGNDALYVTVAAGVYGGTGTDTSAAADGFRAVATAADLVPHSASRTGAGEIRIDGLVNGTLYTVTAYAHSAVGNEGPVSTFGTQVAPQPAADAWKVYELNGGRDSGGCQSGGAGLSALLGAIALLRLGRRS